MPRVAGVDPGTVSFDLCVLYDGEPVLERVFATGSLSDDSGPLLRALASHGPCDLVYGPSGYAFNAQNGELLWHFQCGSGHHNNPTAYSLDGR